jgi:NNP family nitrate/nitrite transporter-like MFS transporter
VAIPALTGSLLRIPFSAWVDTTGGRKPFLMLLSLALVGMAGLTAIVFFLYPQNLGAGLYLVILLLGALCGCGIATFSVGVSQVSYWFPKARQGRALAVFAGVGNLAPGIFSFLLPLALAGVGLAGSYVAWLAFLALGTVLYFLLGSNAWYFQLRSLGVSAADAREIAASYGQSLFPAASLKESLRVSARCWRTWALVLIYFTTFGGFIALTAWLPTYWRSYYGLSPIMAGTLTAVYSVLTSAVRIVGGMLSDRLEEGGENTAILALLILLAGALVMTNAAQYQLALPGVVLMAVGMGLCNAAVFKIVPQAVPEAIGGAAGWVGGLGAFGGFVIPPVMGFAVRDLGNPGYAIGFVTFIFLALLSLTMAWILKYTRQDAAAKPARVLVRQEA